MAKRILLRYQISHRFLIPEDASQSCRSLGQMMLGGFQVAPLLMVIVGGVAAFLLWKIVMGMRADRAARDRRVDPSAPGIEGKHGEVRKAFLPDSKTGRLQGKVFVNGELWKANLKSGEQVPQLGGRVRVLSCQGLELEVEAINAEFDG